VSVLKRIRNQQLLNQAERKGYNFPHFRKWGRSVQRIVSREQAKGASTEQIQKLLIERGLIKHPFAKVKP
jgi:hypothetical protein